MPHQNKAVVYACRVLFRAASETLPQTIAADPKHLEAEIGFFAVLHTWGRDLLHHPHLHCIVTGGGLAPDSSRWIACRPGFFLPVRVLSRRLFPPPVPDLFAEGLRCREAAVFAPLEPLREPPRTFCRHLRSATAGPLGRTIYTKPPFAGPEQILEYVGRYTHRVSISNNRLRRHRRRQRAFYLEGLSPS